MRNPTSIFDDILYKNLSPWHDCNKPDDKFIPLISSLKTIDPVFQQTFEIDFIRHFNNKTHYYHKLIVNEAINYCNQIISLINTDDDIRVKKYWLDVICKKLKSDLKFAGQLIKENDYSLLNINPHNNIYSVDSDHKTDTYVIQLLKTAFIKVYLEIQEVFKIYLPDSLLAIEDFYTQLLFEPIPDNKYISTASKVIHIEPEKQTKTKIEKPGPAPTITSTFRYKNLAKNTDALKDLCDSLKRYDLIDKKTVLSDLKKLFSGGELNKPVIWTGQVSDLYYFVVLIHNKEKYVENLHQQHWKVTCNCFIKSDGSAFDQSNLKSQKKPKINAAMIEKVVLLLK